MKILSTDVSGAGIVSSQRIMVTSIALPIASSALRRIPPAAGCGSYAGGWKGKSLALQTWRGYFTPVPLAVTAENAV